MNFNIPTEGLTQDNYYTPENMAISNSKVRDFLTSKELFYGRHVDHSIPPDVTPAMTLGKYVDGIMERGSIKKFNQRYLVKVLKKDNLTGYMKQQKISSKEPERIITEETYAKVIRMGDKILRAPFYREYKKMKALFQVPLWQPISSWINDSATNFPNGAMVDSFDVCGLLDVLTFDRKNSTVYIDDLKTTKSASMKNPQSWYYKCVDMGYLRQMAFYRWLVMQAYPEYDHYICRHVVISNEKTDLYPLKLFVIPNEMLKSHLEEFFTAAYAIATEERFIDTLPSWSDAETLMPFHPTQRITAMVDGEEMEEI